MGVVNFPGRRNAFPSNPAERHDPLEDMVREVPEPGMKRNSRARKRLSPAAVIARSLAPDAANLTPAEIIARSVRSVFDAFPILDLPPVHVPPEPQSRRAQPRVRDDGEDSCIHDAFWGVWMQHQDYLFKQSLRFMAGNMADAEDALSQAMLKGSQHFESDAIRNQRAWLTRLVHNACMDQYRARRRRQRLSENTAAEDHEDTPALIPRPQRAPDETLHMNQVFEALERQLRALPVSLLEPLLMRVIEDKSYDEIAAQLGLSNCAVRKRIQLARDRLKACDIF